MKEQMFLSKLVLFSYSLIASSTLDYILVERKHLGLPCIKTLNGSSNQPVGLIMAHDREKAASTLAALLKDVVKGIDPNDIYVVGIPRGGVITADVIAKKLNAKFDVVVPRKIRAPYNEELAIGAVIDTENPLVYIDDNLTKQLNISREYIESEKQKQIEEIKRRESLYRINFNKMNVAGKTVILVDDGAARGATLIVSARSIKKLKPHKLIIAIPVAPKGTIELLKKEADWIESLISPSNGKFGAVGKYYQSFLPVSDETAIQIIRKNFHR
jgi:putative phosphoribosyl transferase